MLKVPVTEDDHILGNEHAAVTLVEYGDFECHHCRRAYFMIKELQRHFGEKIRFVFRHFPLSEIHPYAEISAETAEFAGVHRKFWAMHDLLFESQTQLNHEHLLFLAESIGLSVMDLEGTIKMEHFKPKIKEDFLGGVRSGVNGTPTFFINENRYDGPLLLEQLIKSIDKALQSL